MSALFSPDVEKSFIGALIIAPDLLPVIDTQPDELHVIKHRWVYEAMRQIERSNGAIDMMTVSAELERVGKLDEVGGFTFLTELVMSVENSQHVETYAGILRDYWGKRQLIAIATKAANLAFGGQPYTEVAHALITDASAISATAAAGVRPIKEHIDEYYKHLTYMLNHPGEMKPLEFGISDLDKIIEIYAGNLVLVKGGEGVGKTILALQFARYQGGLGNPGAVFEIELDAEQIVRRWVSAEAVGEVSTRNLKRGALGESELAFVHHALAEMYNLPVYMSTDRWTTSTLRSALKRLKDERGIKWFVVDYFDLLGDTHENQNTRDAEMSKALKLICKELGLAGLIVHTLNKMDQSSGSRKIEYAADLSLTLTADASNKRLINVTPSKIRDDAHYGGCQIALSPKAPKFFGVRK